MQAKHSFLVFSFLSLMACILGADGVYAQSVHAITSEFEVSSSSHVHAGALAKTPVAVDGQSRILIVWQKSIVPGENREDSYEAVPPFEFQKGIFVNTYSLDGIALRSPIRIDVPDSEGWPVGPILAADAEGRFVVVWRQRFYAPWDKTELITSIWMRAFSSDGEPLDDPEQLGTADTHVLPSIDMTQNGEFVVMLGRIDPEASFTFGADPPHYWFYDANFQRKYELPKSVDDSLDRPYSLNSAVSLNENGEIAVAYTDSEIYSWFRLRHLRLRTFSNENIALSDPIEVESDIAWGLDIMWLDNEHFVAAWLDAPRFEPAVAYWQVFKRNGQTASQLFSFDRAVGQGELLPVSETEFGVVWPTASGLVLIRSSLDKQAQEIPIQIKGTTFEWFPTANIGVKALEGGQFVVVWGTRIQGRDQVRAEVLEYKDSDNMALFEAEIAGPCVNDRMASVKLSWSSDFDYADIYMAGPPAAKLLSSATGNGELTTGLWARKGMVFQMVDPRTNTMLASVKANPGQDTCPISPIVIDPQVIEVCDPRELTSAQVLWDTTDSHAGHVEVRVNSRGGRLFRRGGPLGSAITGNWLRNATTFYLVEPDSKKLLGTASREYRQIECH